MWLFHINFDTHPAHLKELFQNLWCMADIIGRFLQEEFRKAGIQDPEVAQFLNITVSAVEKIYPKSEIYVSRIILLSKFAGRDFLDEFYYKEEPLKSLRNKEIENFKREIEDLKKLLKMKEDHIKNLEFMNATQQEVIKKLQIETWAIDRIFQ